MSTQICQREHELLDALGRGFVGPELEQHVASCSDCSELRLVAGALLDDRADAIVSAPIPSAGTMWWRMQLRLRQEAEATARKSLLIGQGATLAVAVALVVTFFGADVAFEVRDLIATVRLSTPLLIAVAAWSLAAPIASWVAIRQK
jgi:hypothetical protein